MKFWNGLATFLIGFCLILLGHSYSKNLKQNEASRLREKLFQDKSQKLSHIPDTFRPYVVDFWVGMEEKNFYQPEIVKLRVVFGNTNRYKKTSVAHCNFTDYTVVIKKTYWDTASPGAKQQLMDHELGHCVLQRPDEYHKNPHNPASVMSQTVFNGEHYLKYKDIYRKELFRPETFGAYFKNKNTTRATKK